jgi:phospholipid/cholesterol/gamma-HCH transport system ATP-binding protein
MACPRYAQFPMDAPAHVPEVIVEDLHKAFKGKVVLAGIDLSVGRGEMIAIVGGSGCGKTVLLKHITAHFSPDRGRVLVADHDVDPGDDGCAPVRDIASLSPLELDQIRTHWAVVFQRNALLTGTVMDNLSLLLREVQGMSDETIRPLAVQALSDVGLDPDLVLGRDREELSGGMAKRVAIARALVIDPVLILYDEPTAGLDPEMCVQIHELIRRTHASQPALAARRGGAVRTTIIVTHDTELLQRLKPRIVMLHDGRVLFDGPFEAFTRSDNPHITPYLAQMHQLHHRTLPPPSHDHEVAEMRGP